MNDFLKLLADFEIDLTPGASEKPGKRRGMGLEGPKLDQTPWSAGFGINPHLFAGVCKAGRKKAPPQRS